MMVRKVVILGCILLAAVAAKAEDQPGNIDIRSTLVGTRVYLDDAYVGDADIFLEEVPSGEHIIILRQGSQRLRGEFPLKPGELLMLEGRFDEGRIVDLRQVAKEEALKRAEASRKAEAERKAAEAEAKKQEQLSQKKGKKTDKKQDKKTVVAIAKPTPVVEESGQGGSHLNILRVDFEAAGDVGFKVIPRVNQKIVTNFNDSSGTSGKLYRSKQNFVLCEGSGCFRDWTGRFFYFDDTGKRDAFLIRWRETVFSGITPQGTSKVEVDMCVNGDCKRSAFASEGGAAVQAVVDRYVMSFTRSSLTVRRADLLKAITDKGGKVPEL